MSPRTPAAITNQSGLDPRYCTLPPAEMRQRLAHAHGVFAAARTAEALPEGARLIYADSEATARQLFDFMLAERTCCNTFSYAMGFAPDRSTISLEIRGKGAAANAIRSWVGSAVSVT